MWVDDYFHYKDWEQAQKEVYDSFNLLAAPRKDNDFKYFYNRGTHQRIVPLGIFPHPDGKRTVMTPTVDGHAAELTELTKRGNDSVNIFEKDPMKYLVHKEQLRSSQMRAVNHEITFMTNLQNLKQGLKSDYSDKQVLDTILGNSGFTDGLITEHLRSGPSGARQQGKFLARDPAAYRDFIRASYQSKDQEDPFTHFFIKESGKIERVHKVHNDAKERFAHLAKDAPDK